MIKRLLLEDYGKFRNAAFDFSKVTLFFGPNEAGKTTLFDAVFDGVSNPKGNSEPGKRLKERYGAGRKARLEFDGTPLEIPAQDFLNLFAVRAGSISLEIDKNSEWMNRVKAELFSGGVDPSAVAKCLEDKVKSRGRESIGSEIGRLFGELEKVRTDLGTRKAEREAYLIEEKLVVRQDEKRKASETEASRLGSEIAALKAELEQQNLLRDLKGLERLLARFSEKKKLEEDLEKLGRFSPETREELRRLDEKARTQAAEVERGRAALEGSEADQARVLREKAEAEEEKARLQKAGLTAGVLRKTIADREALLERKTVGSWKPAFLAGAGLSFLLGAVLFFLVPSPVSFVALAAGLALTVVFAVFSYKREVREDGSRLEAALKNVRETWNRETGGDLGEGGYEAVLVALDRAAERGKDAEAAFEKIRGLAAKAEETLGERKTVLRRAKEAADETAAAIKELLGRAGAADREDYAGKLEKRKGLEEKLAVVADALREARGKFGAESDADLEGRLGRKLAELQARATGVELRDQEVRGRENALREKEARLETLRREERTALGDLGRNQGSLRERFKGLPERIADLERTLAEKERLLADRKTALRALEIARDLYASLAGDADSMLAELSKEIGRTFSRVLDADRDVAFETFAVDDAGVTDSGGAKRTGSRLSSGTRDAFLLAARLVLARKSPAGSGGGLVVLDEPFIALDRARTVKALEVLEEFRAQAGWQLVLFTKDELLVEDAGKVYGKDLRVHELG